MPEYLPIKISALPVAGGVSDSDELVINQGGVTARIRKDVLAAAIATTGTNLIAEFDVEGTYEINIQPGYLLTHFVAIGSPGEVKMGTTDGGGEIIDDEITGTQIVYAVPYYFNTLTTIWFTGTFSVRLYFS